MDVILSKNGATSQEVYSKLMGAAKIRRRSLLTLLD
jgi:hypothetical protein